MTRTPITNAGSRRQMMIMRTVDGGWYPIEAYGLKRLADEAADHGELNSHIKSIEDIDGVILWSRQ